MPRNEVEPEYSVEYLSILDENGDLDEKLAPDIDDDLLKRMFRTMLLSRRFDARQLTLNVRGALAPSRRSKARKRARSGPWRRWQTRTGSFLPFANLRP
ncbi:hypothetical protein [Marinobacter halodurans]|uniref:hypothetical protein n=1 Tax=Marinobacter halodurans TaxID=2528979 RepID=UPI001A9545D7|nr:hypothetical protein [Marinobacter halodurans]